MLRQLQAIFLAIILLIPSAAEVCHQWQHNDDVHCSEKYTLHFHQSEHHCSLCDFQLSMADAELQSPLLIGSRQTIVPFQPEKASLHIPSFWGFSDSRGPPTV
ncbi:MAG: hypothetical protein U0T84_00370 [Chitinophagales bacterium]